jgi:hypothetical protein
VGILTCRRPVLGLVGVQPEPDDHFQRGGGWLDDVIEHRSLAGFQSVVEEMEDMPAPALGCGALQLAELGGGDRTTGVSDRSGDYHG